MNEVWSPYPQVAVFSASVKFVLLLLGLFYALVGCCRRSNFLDEKKRSCAYFNVEKKPPFGGLL